jgi:hypothetical protein
LAETGLTAKLASVSGRFIAHRRNQPHGLPQIPNRFFMCVESPGTRSGSLIVMARSLCRARLLIMECQLSGCGIRIGRVQLFESGRDPRMVMTSPCLARPAGGEFADFVVGEIVRVRSVLSDHRPSPQLVECEEQSLSAEAARQLQQIDWEASPGDGRYVCDFPRLRGEQRKPVLHDGPDAWWNDWIGFEYGLRRRSTAGSEVGLARQSGTNDLHNE